MIGWQYSTLRQSHKSNGGSKLEPFKRYTMIQLCVKECTHSKLHRKKGGKALPRLSGQWGTAEDFDIKRKSHKRLCDSKTEDMVEFIQDIVDADPALGIYNSICLLIQNKESISTNESLLQYHPLNINKLLPMHFGDVVNVSIRYEDINDSSKVWSSTCRFQTFSSLPRLIVFFKTRITNRIPKEDRVHITHVPANKDTRYKT
ncbi:unnamed protein product [Lepeophtheirus salmonis]|uniref:(salmon louse) hypothetical protein n=1 Tax=Lepeophtheirus salmonis TaxID=72036 RepID=A0A7R8CP22_LEPSM|nr:unnamed protein product [Lepeophtheirus salmonis]CAF2881794.1 unnamed protein product [Lepeophtheirus salmonis]